MPTLKIKVSDYYNAPSYYSVMPRAIFDALEAAYLNAQEFAEVDKALFDTMIKRYNEKTKFQDLYSL